MQRLDDIILIVSRREFIDTCERPPQTLPHANMDTHHVNVIMQKMRGGYIGGSVEIHLSHGVRVLYNDDIGTNNGL